MKRQIKFRGKRVDTGEWVIGCLVGYHQAYYDGNSNRVCIDSGILTTTEVISDTVGQFTGLLDKNGKEIYEGDIVSITTYHNKGQGETFDFREVFTVEELKGSFWYEYTSKVRYEDGGYWLSESSRNDTSLSILFGDMRHSFPILECEVIGSIHDNPELLKEVKYE